MSRRIAITALATVALAAGGSAQGQSTFWQVPSGSWETASNWTAGVPTASVDAYIDNDGTANLAVAGQSCKDLYLGHTASKSGTLNFSGGGLSSFNGYVGYDGQGVVTHTAGTWTVTQIFSVGEGNAAVGSYQLSGTGVLSTMWSTIGWTGQGTFVQNGGTHTMTDSLEIGHAVGQTSRYELHAGTVTTGLIELGHGASGELIITGGSLSATATTYIGGGIPQENGENQIGTAAGSDGRIELSGSGQLSLTDVELGIDDQGIVVQSGGTATVQNDLTMARNAGTTGAYELSGGTLDLQADVIRGLGESTFVIDGGSLTIGGSQFGVDMLTLGRDTGKTGAHTIGAGLDVATDTTTLGVAGTGTLTQTGGTHTTALLALGDTGSGGTGQYDLQGGTLAAQTIELNDGAFSQTGGTLNYTTFTQTGGTLDAVLAVGPTQTFTLTGGTVIADQIVLGGGGTFDFSGGRLQVATFTGNLVDDGGTIAPGGSAGTTQVTGDLALNAGTLEVELAGLVGGSDYDVVQVTGAASLAGTLDLVLLESFVPSVGDVFTVVQAASVSGRFDTVQGFSVNPSVSLGVTYEPSSVLVIGAIPGDADFNRIVDAQDFSILKAHFVQSPADWGDGNFNYDVMVDTQDFSILKGHYGQHAPEPTAVALLALGWMLLRRPRPKPRLRP